MVVVLELPNANYGAAISGAVQGTSKDWRTPSGVGWYWRGAGDYENAPFTQKYIYLVCITMAKILEQNIFIISMCFKF